MFYIIVAVKLILGLLALVLVINLTGKGNLAPASASDQVQNYVLGGIVGGVIYNTDISIPVFMLILAIWFAAVLSLRWLKKHNNLVKYFTFLLKMRGKLDYLMEGYVKKRKWGASAPLFLHRVSHDFHNFRNTAYITSHFSCSISL